MNHIYLTLLNLFLCTLWAYGSFCRLRAVHRGVVVRIRMVYVGMMVWAFASGFQFQLFGVYAGWGDVFASTVMVSFITLGKRRWKHGVPHDLLKQRSLL